MKCLYQRDNEFRFIPESFEDLWHLSLFIEPGDHVESISTRKIKSEDSRNVKIKKIHVLLEVEKIELKKESNELKLLGKILRSTEEISGYHSVHITLHQDFRLIKNNPINQYLLKKMLSSTNSKVFLGCVFDNHEAVFFELYATRVNVLEEFKLDETLESEDRFRELFQKLDEYTLKKDYLWILLGFSVFWKQIIDKLIASYSWKNKVQFVNINNPTTNGIYEILHREEMKNLLKDLQIKSEEDLINEFLRRLNSNDRVEYGQDVLNLVNLGAIETLIISEDLVLENKEILEILKEVEKMGGRFVVLETENAKKVINNFGKIVGFLRYNVR
ncbi:MAG: hypothetical protein QW524_02285 [Candidatus Woesearchaeota archaeon]